MTTVCNVDGCPDLAVARSRCGAHDPGPWRKTHDTPRTLTPAARRAIMQRDNGLCYACGNAANQIDHVTPQAEGGTDEPRNLAAICDECHDRKTKNEASRGRTRARNRG